ncbi:MAG TPA: toll/interleukin-1 receptor domain-containing protein [Acidobacteriaceae bacterium]|nr:toll/interleukin-1 receptor domain-containing protein [Acidobacteriaceae bacterium]
MQMKESDWRALLTALRNGNLVPMLGTDFIRVQDNGRSTTYDNLIARELAKRHDIEDADLTRISVSLEDATLNDVVAACVRKEGDNCRFDLHYDVWQIIQEMPVEAASALAQLAEISDISLFVTSTCDPLFETILGKAGQVDARVYRCKDKAMEDLPKEARTRKGTRSLYYLLGKAEPGTMDFSICDEELLRFIRRLHDSTYRPRRLFDALRESNLLLLGVSFSDWLARFFLWLARDRDNLSADEARYLREYLADQKAGKDQPFVMFLQNFSHSTIMAADQPGEFVAELHRRWLEQSKAPQTSARGAEPAPPSAMPRGAVFLSYSRSDAPAVKTLYAELTRAGIPAWYDAALQAGDEFDTKLDYNIQNCSLFLPLISTGSLGREQGYFRREWKKAVERDERFYGTSKGGIVPIVIDEDNSIMRSPESCEGMPRRFRELQMYHCPLGRPTPDLISSLRALPHSPASP